LAKTPRTWTGARTPSGLKRVRQAARRHEVLGPRRSAAKTYVAKALTLAANPVEGSDPTAALTEALSALDRAAKFLEKSLKQGTITGEMPHASMPDGDTRALVVLTLNRLGRAQPSYVSTLWRERAKLSPFGVAMLAVTVSEGGGDKSLLEPMLAYVAGEAKKELDKLSG